MLDKGITLPESSSEHKESVCSYWRRLCLASRAWSSILFYCPICYKLQKRQKLPKTKCVCAVGKNTNMLSKKDAPLNTSTSGKGYRRGKGFKLDLGKGTPTSSAGR